MKEKTKKSVMFFFRNVFMYVLAFCIPAFLAIDGFQARRFAELEAEVKQLDKMQLELVEENKQLVIDISVLASSDRIEKFAETELAMHRATSDEIVRIDVNGN